MIFLKNRLVLFLFVLLSPGLNLFAQTKKAAANKKTLKLMSYNIRIASPPSKGWGYTDLPATAKVITDAQPDLVALQEVDVFTERSGKEVHQAKKLAELTGMYYHFAKAVDRSGGSYGVAVLSRFPVKKAESYQLSVVSDHPDTEVRAAAIVTVKTPLGRIVFVSAHLDHLNDIDRAHQISQLNGIMDKHKKLSVILGADLNTTPLNPTIQGLAKHLEIPCTSCKPTFPADAPIKTLDYLILNRRAASRFKKISYDTVNETYASDHLPLVMILEKN